MIPEFSGYDSALRDNMEHYFPDTDGVLWFNDGFQKHNLNTLCILGRKYYQRFGYIYHPAYKSLWCDNEFTVVASLLKKQLYFDKVIIRHTVISIPDENTTIVKINEADVLEHYRMSLLELNLLNTDIPLHKLKIIARLIGALNADGHIGVRNNENNQYYESSFNVGEEYDVYQLADDIKTLGFGNVSIRRKISKFEDKNNGRTTTSTTWEVAKSGDFAYFMCLMGGFSGKKIQTARPVKRAELVGALLDACRAQIAAP
jgi:hypothetical protein